MYRIIMAKTGEEIGNTEKPIFIYKKASSGCYVQTSKENAKGVAYKGTAYNLQGTEGVGADETAMLIEFDGGDATTALTAQQAQNRADIDYIAMETGVEL